MIQVDQLNFGRCIKKQSTYVTEMQVYELRYSMNYRTNLPC